MKRKGKSPKKIEDTTSRYEVKKRKKNEEKIEKVKKINERPLKIREAVKVVLREYSVGGLPLHMAVEDIYNKVKEIDDKKDELAQRLDDLENVVDRTIDNLEIVVDRMTIVFEKLCS